MGEGCEESLHVLLDVDERGSKTRGSRGNQQLHGAQILPALERRPPRLTAPAPHTVAADGGGIQLRGRDDAQVHAREWIRRRVPRRPPHGTDRHGLPFPYAPLAEDAFGDLAAAETIELHRDMIEETEEPEETEESEECQEQTLSF
jgi:hypothetical protein